MSRGRLLNHRPVTTTVSATHAKNEFGSLLDKVIQGGTVVITRHDAPKAVLISMAEFNHLSRADRIQIDTLSGDFDALLARMQKPAVRAGMKAAFAASPKELGKAAVAAARQRGR
jgi:antitoxin Phd